LAKLDLSLTPDELDRFLAAEHTVRVATVDGEGMPHVIPLWFVWVDGVMFLNSTKGNVTVDNMLRSGRASAVIDDGETYDSLRGAVISGRVEGADDDPRLPDAERTWSEKYLGGNEPPYRHWKGRMWLRLIPERIASWDFRKIPEARAKRDAARGG
jgi:nitroimidazol reductase NimA-like FMN-containing flavoprotein (pyridoxamine 5'-phosphate oxidase superfamily)